MLRITSQDGEIFEVGTEVQKTETTAICERGCGYTMKCNCIHANVPGMEKTSAEMMAGTLDFLTFCSGAFPLSHCYDLLAAALKKEGYVVDVTYEECGEPDDDELPPGIVRVY